MIERRAFVAGMAAVIGASRVAGAEQERRLARIGILAVASTTDTDAMRLNRRLEMSLRELGYVSGKNIVIEYRVANGTIERLPNLAADLVSWEADVIVAWGPPAADAAKHATRTVPVVFLAVGGPIDRGLVDSLSRPGGNMTGVAFWASTTIAPKMFELAKEIVPRLARLAVLRPVEHGATDIAAQAAAARSLGVHLVPVPFRDAADVAEAFSAIARARAQALVITGGSLPWYHREMIIRSAAATSIPVIYGWREAVVAGGLISLGTNLETVAERGAAYVDKILKGGKPADLPVEQPTTFELVINLKTARALGLTMPPALLARADVIE
jgi:putative tryptophan/tyrosine transport system substrate-binding protein